MYAFTPWLCQIWNGQKLVTSIENLSIDAGREIARAHNVFGEDVRLWAENGAEDYIEVWPAQGPVRRGTFGETTLVRVPA